MRGQYLHAGTLALITIFIPLGDAYAHCTVGNAAGQRVDAGRAQAARGNKMELQVPLKPLPPGTYKVDWHVLSVDTHKTQGSYTFSVGR